MPRSVHPEDREAWLSLRAKTIGSSESTCLMGSAKYMTEWQLFMEKSGRLPPEDLDDVERILIGECVEPGIAEAAARKFDVKLRKTRRYLIHDEIDGMGASLDFEILTEDAGWVPAEVKNVDLFIFLDDWQTEGDEIIPPLHIWLQVQHQLTVAAKPYGFLIVLVGGNRLYLQRIDRDEKECELIEAAVVRFWKDVEAGHEPAIDYVRDYQGMCRVYLEDSGEELDATDNGELHALFYEAAKHQQAAKFHEDRYETIKGQLFELYHAYRKVMLPDGSLTFRTAPEKPARTVEYKPQPEKREMRVNFKKALKESVSPVAP